MTGSDGPSYHGLWDLALPACPFQIACPTRLGYDNSCVPRSRIVLPPPCVSKGRRATDHGRTHIGGPTLGIHHHRIGAPDVLWSQGCHESTMHGRRPVPQRGADRGEPVDPLPAWPISPAPSHTPLITCRRCDCRRGTGAHLATTSGDTPATRTYTLGLPPAYIPNAKAATTSFPRTHRPAIRIRCKSLLNALHEVPDPKTIPIPAIVKRKHNLVNEKEFLDLQYP